VDSLITDKNTANGESFQAIFLSKILYLIPASLSFQIL